MSTIDPTAPGGMSEAALVAELTVEGDYDKATATALTWPQKIDAVIALRQEIEEAEEAKGFDEGFAAAEAEMDSIVDPDEEDDFADLAEFDEPESMTAKTRSSLVVDGVGVVEEVEPTIEESGNTLFIGMPNSKDYIFDGHYGASPSGAERWMTCTASLAATRSFLETMTPNQQEVLALGGSAARQGTTAHAASAAEAELMLGRIDQNEYDNTILSLTLEPDAESEAYDETMAEWITEYGDLIKDYADARGPEAVLIEARVEAVIELMTVDADGDYDQHVITGSADLSVLPTADDHTLVVGDLKYGVGIDVDVEHNPQVRIYALGVLSRMLDAGMDLDTLVEKVRYHIVQPRLGGTKTWEESLDDLLTWRDEVLSPALTEALGGLKSGARFAPSEGACQWCLMRGACPALTEARIEEATELFDVIQATEFETGIEGAFPETESLSNEKLGTLYAQISALTKIADDLKAEAQRRLHRGEEIPGYKLVCYTPPRYWEEDALDALSPETQADEGGVLAAETRALLWTQPKLLSPTQALALLKKEGLDAEALDDLIVAPDKKPVISTGPRDKRKEWAGTAPEQMFPDLEEEA